MSQIVYSRGYKQFVTSTILKRLGAAHVNTYTDNTTLDCFVMKQCPMLKNEDILPTLHAVAFLLYMTEVFTIGV
jgi:hypothetical protein